MTRPSSEVRALLPTRLHSLCCPTVTTCGLDFDKTPPAEEDSPLCLTCVRLRNAAAYSECTRECWKL